MFDTLKHAHVTFRNNVCGLLGLSQVEIDTISDHGIFERIQELVRLEGKVKSGAYIRQPQTSTLNVELEDKDV